MIHRTLTALILTALLGSSLAAPQLTYNGQTVKVTVITQNGAVLVELDSLQRWALTVKAAFKGPLAQLAAGATTLQGKRYVTASAVGAALGFTVRVDAQTGTVALTPATPQVKTTTQLSGGEGQFGKLYTLGQAAPLNVKLRSAEYGVGLVTVGRTVLAPTNEEKWLTLHLTLHNPGKVPVDVSGRSLKVTAVDAQNRNHEFMGDLVPEGSSDVFQRSLLPNQSADVVLSLAVPAAGPIVKLVIQHANGGNVVRYDLRTLKGVGGVFTDASDPSGVGVAATVQAVVGQPYPLTQFAAQLESVSSTTEPLGGRPPEGGKRYVVATLQLSYPVGKTAAPVGYSYSSFEFQLRDSDGDKYRQQGYLLKASRDESASGELAPGEAVRVRVYFEVPDAAVPTTLSMSQISNRGTSRTYVYTLGALP